MEGNENHLRKGPELQVIGHENKIMLVSLILQIFKLLTTVS